MMTTSQMSTTTDTTHAVLSQDGAKISYLSMGSGPSVLVLPGALSMAAGYEKKLAEKNYLDAFVEFSLAVGPERARNTSPWLMKLLLPLFLNSHERKLMLGLLPENLREHQEVARLDSSYENYREIPADVLLMYGGKSNVTWVDMSMERL